MKNSYYYFLLLSLIILLLVASCGKKEAPEPDPQPVTTIMTIVDKSATPATKALYANLWMIRKIAPMFGHHDYSAYGVGWRDVESMSDVRSLCGDYPALLSVDISGAEQGKENNINNIPFSKLRLLIKQCHSRGGVIMICWHQNNPVTGGNAWDNAKAVDKILLEGGDINTKYKEWLGNISDFILSLRDDNNELIPVIFRPLHEHTQTWSWWGSSATTDSEFVNLWKMIVKYLRDTKNVHNLLYAISPQMDSDYGAATTDRLKFRWPGDDFVDVIGMDCYHGTNINAFKSNLSYLSALSTKLMKPAGVTETGIPSGRASDYWTRQIADPVSGVYCSMVVMWRNESTSHAYGPYPGDNSASDFIQMYNSKKLVFEKSLPDMYSMPKNVAIQ